MYHELLQYLECPACVHTTLLLIASREEDDEVVEGAARCEHCGSVARILDGILDMLGEAGLPRTPAQLTNYAPPAARGYERLWRWQALTLLTGRRFPLREELRLVRALMAPDRGGLVLDVACSTGLYARALVHPSVVVAAVDHSWAMLREARRYARREGKTISFVRASAQRLPFRASCAAGYGMGGSLNEIGDIDACLREARRVLAADGRFVSMNLLAARSRRGRLVQAGLAPGGIEFPPVEDLNRRFGAAGLRLAAQWRWQVVAISLLLHPRSANTRT